MKKIRIQKTVGMNVSFFIAALCMLLPLTTYWSWFRPQWILLVLLYRLFYSKKGFSLGSSWLIGLCVDLMSGAMFGQYALLMVLLNYGASFFVNRFQLRGVLMQNAIILFLLALTQISLYAAYYLFAQPVSFYGCWATVFSSLLLWPIVYALLTRYERKIVY